MIVSYVADRSRLHQLLMSIASWQRFETLPVAVIDIGLTASCRDAVRRICDDQVDFLAAAVTGPMTSEMPDLQKVRAFEQKALLGSCVQGDPIVFLDTDILVVHRDFMANLSRVEQGTLAAAPSAWDRDFTWTYTASSLQHLKRLLNLECFSLNYPICNSGVWAMRKDSASAVSPIWHKMFRSAIDDPYVCASIKPGTGIGDQEFLLPACSRAGVLWNPLPGTFNMQVHHALMPWRIGNDGHPRGGHKSEPSGLILAVHYGCDADGTAPVPADVLPCSEVRDWLKIEYETCWRCVINTMPDGELML